MAYRDSDDTFLFSADGSTRMVYLINGVIYKVEGFEGTNEAEYDKILNTRESLPAGVFYPETSLFTIDGENIIAMEYIEGTAIYDCYCVDMGDECDSVCMTDSEKFFLVCLIDDPSGMNIIRNIHGYYIVDAA